MRRKVGGLGMSIKVIIIIMKTTKTVIPSHAFLQTIRY